MKRVLMSLDVIETPADLTDGEVVEGVRVGGPRDGGTVGYFRVELGEGDELALHPVEAAEGSAR